MNRMHELKAVFENEEAARLLNYFISHKEIVNKNEKRSDRQVGALVKIEVFPRTKLLVVK